MRLNRQHIDARELRLPKTFCDRRRTPKVRHSLSQIYVGRCCTRVDALSEAIVEMKPDEAPLEIEAVFHAHYQRIARVITRVIRDPARAEELAVEVLLKWSRDGRPREENIQGWLYRTAVRHGLNELRRHTRQSRYERMFAVVRRSRSPEELLVAQEEQNRVRSLLNAIGTRNAELLILRSDGLSYEELASALNLNPASIGTFLSRAQQAFRKEYIKLYGNE